MLDLPTPHDFVNYVELYKNEQGITPNFGNRIVGGATASPGQFPYQVSLRTPANAHFCGGSIINNHWILSAAHCTINRNIDNTVIVAGAHSRLSGGVTFPLADIINHPDYHAPTIAWDVCVLRTTSAISYNNLISPIALGSHFVAGGVMAVVSGWGLLSSPGSLANELQFVHVQTWNNPACVTALGASGSMVFDHKICAGGIEGQGVCSADSGGPLVVGNYQVGVVSWGVPCARGFPDGYDRVQSHFEWIMRYVQ